MFLAFSCALLFSGTLLTVSPSIILRHPPRSFVFLGNPACHVMRFHVFKCRATLTVVVVLWVLRHFFFQAIGIMRLRFEPNSFHALMSQLCSLMDPLSMVDVFPPDLRMYREIDGTITSGRSVMQHVSLMTRDRATVCRLCGRKARGREQIPGGPQFGVCCIGPYRCTDIFLAEMGCRFHRPPLSQWLVKVLDGIFIRRPRGRSGIEIPMDAWMIIVAFARPNGAYRGDDYVHQSTLKPGRGTPRQLARNRAHDKRMTWHRVNVAPPDCNHSRCGFHCVCGKGRNHCKGKGYRFTCSMAPDIMNLGGMAVPPHWYPTRRTPPHNVQCATQ